MVKYFRKIWAIFAITSLLVTQTGGVLAGVNPLPDSPNALTPPVLLAPGDGASTNNTTPTFSWQADAGAVGGYQLQIDDSNDFLTPIIDQFQPESSFIPAALAEGTYYWHVQSSDGVDWSGWSVTWSLTIDITPPGTPVLGSPPNGVLTNDNYIAFSWGVVVGADQYTLQVSTAVDFSSVLIDLSQPGTFYDPGGPLSDGLYYWRVSATDLAGNTSTWSDVWSLTVDTTPPAVPNQVAPTDASFTSDNTPVFSWESVPDAAYYFLQVAADSGFTNLVDQMQVGTNFAQVSPLADGLYYWRVYAADAANNKSAWSEVWSVTVDTTPPDVPGLLTPADISFTNDNTPSFNWSPVAGAVQYTLQVSTLNTFDTQVISQTQSATSFTPVSPLADGLYYWRVNATDAVNNKSAWSNVWSVTVDTTPPDVPGLLAPADISFTNDNTPFFNWSPAAEAIQYTLQVSTSNTFDTQVISQTQSVTSFTPVSPLADGLYYWRVNSADMLGNTSDWSLAWSFTVDTASPPVPILTSPDDGAFTNDNTPTLTWDASTGAIQYQLQVDNNINFNNPEIDLLVGSSTYTPGSSLGDGNYYWHVRAVDAAGNWSGFSARRSFTIDISPPATPNLTAPVDAALTSDNTPTFTWSAAMGASQYQIQVDNDSDFSSTLIDQLVGSLSFTPGIALNDGTLYWHVQSVDSAGNLSGFTTARSITIDTTPPAVPVLTSPLDTTLTNINTPTLTWSTSTGANQYRLQVSTVVDFATTVIDLLQPGTSFTPGSPLADGLYYWRVNASDLAGNTSAWSAAWSLTIDTLPPDVPLLLAPADAAMLNDTTPDFSWEPVIGAVSYRLQIGLNGSFSPPTQNLVITQTSFTLVTPLIEGAYAWRVRASDAAGNASAYSPTRAFTIDVTPPAVPVLTAPANGSLTNDNMPLFSWNASTGASQYQIQVDNDSDFSSTLFDQLVGVSSFTPLSAIADGTYYWRARALDAAGNISGWSVTWSVVIDTTAPGVPTLDAPADGMFTNNNIPTFGWNAVLDAAQYQLQVSLDSNFSPLVIDQVQSGLVYTPPSSQVDGLYYWRVRAIDAAANPSAWSIVRTLTIDTQPPAIPALASPADGSVSADNTPAFSWNTSTGASQYRLQVDNNNNFLTPEIDQWVGALSFTPVGALVDGTYFWHVQAIDVAGNLSGWSVAWSVVIDATPPGVPDLLSPADASLTNDNTPSFAWSPVAGASSYTLQVSAFADFSVLAINQVQGWTGFTPAGPLVDGVYYWRVNATDSVGNPSSWSATWSLVVDTDPPLAPGLLTPADASFTADNTPGFSWNSVIGAAQYTLQVSTVADFASTVISQALPGTGFTPASPLGDGVYYWRVSASDLAGNTSVWSVTRSFTVDTVAPGVPTLLAPLDGAALNDATPDFSWSVVVDAESYHLQIDADANFTPPILLNLGVNGASYTLVAPLSEGVYYWRVRSSDAAGNTSVYSAAYSFTIDTTPPAIPALTAPLNGTTTNDSTPTFTWNTSTGASQYQIQVDDANDFLGPLFSELSGAPSFTPLASLVDGTYYWHVRAIDAAGNMSGWSAIWSVLIDTTAPAAPVLTAPLDAAFTNDKTPTFSWNAVPEAAQYQLQVDDDPAFLSLTFEQLTAATSVTPVISLNDATFYWHVRARDAVGNWGEWSAARSFTIDTVAPAAPTLVAPLDGTITADSMPVFSWASVAGAVSYRLVVDTSGGFSSPYIIDQTLSGLSYSAPAPIPDGSYIWRVRAIDAAGNQSSYSPTRGFTIDTTASSIPTLIEPANGGIIADPTPTFTWGASAGAVLYIIQVDDNSNFASPLIDTSTANTSYTPANPLADGTYFWHVQAKDAADNLSAWSATWSLVADSTPPAVPSLVSPSEGLVTSDNTPTFTWSVSGDAVLANIQVDDNNDFSSPLVNQTVGGSSFTGGTILVDGGYFWRVRALDAAGNLSDWSTVRGLLVDTTSPDVPQLLDPLADTKMVDNTPTFYWVEPPGATQYQIQVDLAGDFINPLVEQIVNQGNYTVLLSLGQAKYRWRVKAGDGAGNWSDWSPVWDFEVFDVVQPKFVDDFESGTLGKGWSVITTDEGRVQVAGNLIPGAVYSGNYSLFLDDQVPGSLASRSSAILTIDLSGVKMANLSFAWRDFLDEGDGSDGVFISDDYGDNWYYLLSFDGNLSQYKTEQIDLVAKAASYGISLNDHIQIKFQFYGANSITDTDVNNLRDGYGIDDVQVNGYKFATYLPMVNR